MDAPADKTAKRISNAEWFARYDANEVARPERNEQRRAQERARTPADRIAVRV